MKPGVRVKDGLLAQVPVSARTGLRRSSPEMSMPVQGPHRLAPPGDRAERRAACAAADVKHRPPDARWWMPPCEEIRTRTSGRALRFADPGPVGSVAVPEGSLPICRLGDFHVDLLCLNEVGVILRNPVNLEVAGKPDITEVARRAGVPASTLRFYEEKGLIAPIGLTRTASSLSARACRSGC